MAYSPLPNDTWQYEPPAALWELVEKSVPPHERQEIRKMLGESLVEQSLELHQEVNTLLEIWREYREETEDLFTKHRLPEPPAARERLKQEIKFFVQSLREKAKDTGRDPSQALDNHKTEILDYALDTERAPSSGYYSRPSTAMSSRDGRETPLRIGTPPTDRNAMVATLSDEVEAINDKLTYLKFDEVVQHLRETLEDEVTQLTRDIEFLQSCLDDEADFRGQSGPSREPTLTELREERSKLEKDLLSSVSSVPSVLRGNNTSSLKSVPSSINQSAMQRNRVTSSFTNTTNTGSKKPSPVKANHQISPPGPLKACHQISPSSGSVKARQQVSPAGPMKASHKISSETNNHQNIVQSSGARRKSQENTTIHNKDLKQQRSSSASSNKFRFQIPDTPPEHLTVRVNSKSKASSSNGNGLADNNLDQFIPSPPSSAKPSLSRPGSAQKFRSMVMNCRDGQ